MMINAVPSYCVSLELLLSESGRTDTIADDVSECSEELRKRSLYRSSTFPIRWYVLFIYCASSFMQVVLWNTWSPIANSVLFAYPFWQPSTIALLSNWGSITFILFIVPSCWVLNKKGIRVSFIVGDLLCTVGSGIRCLPVSDEYFTVNVDVTVLALSAALCSGITGPWLSLLTIMFSRSGITQRETAKLGFWTVVCSCLLGLSVSKVSDYCPKHLKTILFLFIAFADIMFLWILLLTSGIVCFNKGFLVIAVMCGLATVWSTPALFYELGVELAYPVPEGLVAGYMMSLNNCVSCLVYVILYIFPLADVAWMNYALVILGISSLITLCFTRERYNRLFIDDDRC